MQTVVLITEACCAPQSTNLKRQAVPVQDSLALLREKDGQLVAQSTVIAELKVPKSTYPRGSQMPTQEPLSFGCVCKWVLRMPCAASGLLHEGTFVQRATQLQACPCSSPVSLPVGRCLTVWGLSMCCTGAAGSGRLWAGGGRSGRWSGQQPLRRNARAARRC